MHFCLGVGKVEIEEVIVACGGSGALHWVFRLVHARISWCCVVNGEAMCNRVSLQSKRSFKPFSLDCPSLFPTDNTLQ